MKSCAGFLYQAQLQNQMKKLQSENNLLPLQFWSLHESWAISIQMSENSPQ